MHRKLIIRYTLVTSATLLAIMAIFAFVNVRAFKNVLLQEAIHDVDNLSETILSTTHYQMLENDRERVAQMIEEVGEQPGIEHIRLVNKDGVIIYSTERGEIGSLLDKKAEACNMCHSDDTPLTHTSSMNRSRIFKTPGGREVLGMARGIYNEPSCSSAACHFHPREVKLLGVLDVTVSLKEMRLQTGIYRNNIVVLTLWLLLLLCLCLVVLTQKLVNQPVTRLLEKTRMLARGKLETRIYDIPKNEIGELALAFNEMAANLQRAHNDLQESATTLEERVEERTQEIRQMQNKLVRSEKLASLGELVAGIAHEINNPLTGILMYASMLESDPRLARELQGDLGTIVQETQRCAGIVRELLDFSRESIPQKSLTAIDAIMDKTLSLVKHQPTFHNILVERHYDPDLPDVLIDPNQLQQVFMNIIVNGGQAMPEGGTLTISTALLPAGHSVSISISDTGPGIRGENLEKIFDPFFTTKGHKGTGLGLSVSYGIVENHGGQLEVDSREGEGTTFTITLPIGPPPAAQPQPATAPSPL